VGCAWLGRTRAEVAVAGDVMRFLRDGDGFVVVGDHPVWILDLSLHRHLTYVEDLTLSDLLDNVSRDI
jgi:hypothetical protein